MKDNAIILPELLAPAGNMECLRAALYFGADAVYLAGKRFGLRAFAANFTGDELIEAVRLAHSMGKRIYVTVNAILGCREAEAIDDYLAELKAAEVDAVIVSDPGVVVAALGAGLTVHLSTQASTANHRSAEFWQRAGVERIVLARETPLTDIAYIKEKLPSLELEAFVHGAMCVAYSGRCLLSSVFTGRSGNRGECAQPCRWKYKISEAGYPGEELPIMEDERGTYILNSRDLNMLPHLGELIRAGICSLKIEGRMKSVYYVASVVNAYRRALQGIAREGLSYKPSEELLEELTLSATRKFTTGFFFGNEGGLMQDTDRLSPKRGYQFCGYVKSGRTMGGLIEVEQRGKFNLGDTLYVLSPNMGAVSFKVNSIINARGEAQTSAPHPQQKIFIDCPYPLCKGDILRIKAI